MIKNLLEVIFYFYFFYFRLNQQVTEFFETLFQHLIPVEQILITNLMKNTFLLRQILKQLSQSRDQSWNLEKKKQISFECFENGNAS